MIKITPNKISLFRLIFGPIISLIVLLLHHKYLISSFLCASIISLILLTDLLDGYLARSKNLCTDVGSMLDALADKFIIYLILIYYLAQLKLNFVLFYFLLIRDFFVSGIKLLQQSSHNNYKVVFSAKLKMFLECILSIMLIYNYKYSDHVFSLVLIVAFFSAYKYFKNYIDLRRL